ncbi:hypothetical protein [Scytonema sp. NUACC26]|uniref:hypothetical protein n=1 Tax=Scytonema sp. NUACC26 TaxID=3140176 RepID=UPI0034DBE115
MRKTKTTSSSGGEKLTQANNEASHNGKGEHLPSEIYENLDPGLWSKADLKSGEIEILFNPQLPEEILPESTDDNEDGSPNPKRN